MIKKPLIAGLAGAALIITTALAVTQSPTPSSSAAGGDPIKAAFYYPWFPETELWKTQYAPQLGKYDSANRTVIASHVAQAKYAGLDAFIASWWGKGTKTASRYPAVLDVAAEQDFKITPYYEPASLAPSAATVKADFDALAEQSTHPAWLVVGKPVLFVYNIDSDGTCEAVKKYKEASAGRFHLNLKVFGGYRACLDQPDSWHQYGPAVPYDQQSAWSATVSPGFHKFNETEPRLKRDLGRFRADLERQAASGAKWQLVTTFNEWGEGTSVEPATQWQSASGMGDYLDTMRAVYLGAPSGTVSPTLSPSSASPSGSPSVTPTVTPSSASPSATESSASPTTASPTPAETVTPTAAAVADPVIAAAGDVACEPGRTPGSSCQHKAVSDKILADTEVDLVLALGDLQYDAGSLAGFQKSYGPTWGRFKAKTKPVPGNHEYGTADAAGYYEYFGSLAGAKGKGYYSFDVGAWHFIALNSEKDISATGAQVTWLKADLAKTTAKCVGAFFHKPRWSTGLHGDHPSMDVFVKPLVAAKADLILSGHDHSYERFQPVNAAGQADPDGIVQIVSGLGGRNHYAVAGRALTAAKDNTGYGYSRLTLHADGATVQYVPAVGNFTDSAKINCH